MGCYCPTARSRNNTALNIRPMEIQSLPLAWRWTDEKYALLPEDVLAKISPLPVEESVLLYKASLSFLSKDGLNEKLFSIIELSTSDASSEEVTTWLRERHQVEDTLVYLSWQPDLAVKTTWGVFCEYWSDFCYPVSDDLVIRSNQCKWVFLYHHEESMQHGIRLKTHFPNDDLKNCAVAEASTANS